MLDSLSTFYHEIAEKRELISGSLEDIEPGYFYFMDKNGKPKGSFGGGQVGSTHLMTRKLIIDSLVYLTQTSGANAPGLYIYGENNEWTLISNGAVVS